MSKSTISASTSRVESSRRSIDSSKEKTPESQEKKVITATTTSVSRNVSSDNAVQINGSVAGTIYNFNFENLVINCQCSSRSKNPTPANKNSLRIEHLSDVPQFLRTPRTTSTAIPPAGTDAGRVRISPDIMRSDNVDDLQTLVLNHPKLADQNLCLSSQSMRNQRIVRAIFRPGVPDNFIATRIVRRLELATQKSPTIPKEHSCDGFIIAPTRSYVDLACHAKNGVGATYRFVVAKDPPFDLLFGHNSMNPSS